MFNTNITVRANGHWRSTPLWHDGQAHRLFRTSGGREPKIESRISPMKAASLQDMASGVISYYHAKGPVAEFRKSRDRSDNVRRTSERQLRPTSLARRRFESVVNAPRPASAMVFWCLRAMAQRPAFASSALELAASAGQDHADHVNKPQAMLWR